MPRGTLSAAGVRCSQSSQPDLRPFFPMSSESNSSAPKLSPYKSKTSTERPEVDSAQLSDCDGVDTSVSTAAMDQAALLAGITPPAMGMAPVVAGAGALSDADVMLRVKAGDAAAFDYLVQKYRRPLISFMYRMARNTA